MSSTDVVKKRGRPKKVPVEETSEAAKKTTTRQKSTKAATAPTLRTAATAATPLKPAAVAEKAATKPIARHLATEPSLKQPPAPIKPPATPAQSLLRVTPADSEILSKVREISMKATVSSPQSEPPKPPPPPQSITAKPIMAPPPPPKISTTKPAPPPAASKVPIAALNSTIVSQITTRAGARPGAKADGQLPKNYRSTARRVTMAIVAMPIAIVTSWVLYQRLVLGEERKLLVAPGMAKVERDPGPAAEGLKGSEGKE